MVIKPTSRYASMTCIFRIILVVELLISGVPSSNVKAAGSDISDPSFGSSGKVLTDFTFIRDDYGYSMEIQPTSGKIVVVGSSVTGGNTDFAVARYNPDGTPDITFNKSGRARTDFGSTDEGSAVVIQTFIISGKTVEQIVIIGTSNSTSLAMTRYSEDGSRDTSFGTNGKILITGFGVATAAAVQSSNKILIAGYRCTATCDFILARFNPNGTSDASFGTSGVVIVDFNSSDDKAYDMAIDPDGKIVLTGSSNNDIAISRFSDTGILDLTFNTTGKVVTDFGSSNEYAHGIAFQSDKKIIMTGQTDSNVLVARYIADGSLDATFGTGGSTISNLGSVDEAYDVSVQTDDKIVVTGTSSGSLAIVRFSSAGILDTSFNTTGILLENLSAGDDRGYAVVIKSDGKIIAAGYGCVSTCDFQLARFDSTASLDTTFGSGGKSVTDFGIGSDDVGMDLAIQSDSKIVVAGYSDSGADYDFALVRYNTNGSMDSSFGSSGKVITDFNISDDKGYAIAIQADGKIVVTGRTTEGAVTKFALIRYTSSGNLDPTFGTGGKVTTTVNSSGYASSVLIQGDGKIVVAGSILKPDGSFDFVVARYEISGILDTTFGTNGIVTTDFSAHNDYGYKAALQPDGKIVVAGYSDSGLSSKTDFAVARYNTDGSLDVTFSTDGKAFADFNSVDNAAYSLLLQADGKIVLVGDSSSIGSKNLTLMRFNSDGSLDTGFGNNGVINSSTGYGWSGAYAVAIQPDGDILAGGYSTNLNIDDDFTLARFKLTGNLDISFASGGSTTNDFNSRFDTIFGISIQKSNKTFTAAGKSCESGNGTCDFAVARYIWLPTFADVPFDYSLTMGGINYPLHDYIEALWSGDYTAGCGASGTYPLNFCPGNRMTRAESAVFMLRGTFGASYVPPLPPWDTFVDDWTPGVWAEKWAEGMWLAKLTAGCQTPPTNPVIIFCPWDLFPRVQAAVFGLRMKYGADYGTAGQPGTPPPATGTLFADMTNTGFWGTKWAEKAYLDGLIVACGTQGGKPLFYCPVNSDPYKDDNNMARAWASYLIVQAKPLPLPIP